MRHYRDRSFHSNRHSDESILWNLTQEVCRREEEFDRRISASSQLKEFVEKGDHKQLIMRNLDQLLNSLLDVFFERSGENLQTQVVNVLAGIGYNMGYDSYPFFQWILRQIQVIANDNVRNFLLKSITRLLELEQKKKMFGKVIGLVMDALQSLLEGIDNPDQLSMCIDPIVIIADNYPQIFTKHFRDTVDILVGWHIDHTQKNSLTKYSADSLIKLQIHWQNDLDFSLTLLSQFLEDMEAYAEDLSRLSGVDHDVCIQKMAALMRVFSTVVRSIGPVFHTNTGPPISEQFVLEVYHMLQRIVVCSQLVGDVSLTVTQAADICARLLIGAIQWQREDMLSESLLTYAVHAVERSQAQERVSLVLDFVTVMVQEIGSALPSWFISGLLGPSSRLLLLKHSKDPNMRRKLLVLYQACLSIKSVSLLQTAYKHVTGEFQRAINGLIDHQARNNNVDISDRLCIFTDNSFDSGSSPDFEKSDSSGFVFGQVQKLLTVALFNISALSVIADTKNSLIGMYALSPNIFDLFHSELDLLHDKLALCYPALQYAALYSFYSHCQRHRHFLNSFTSQSNPASPGSDTLHIDSVTTTTSTFYLRILRLIAHILTSKHTALNARLLLLHWSQELLQEINGYSDEKRTLTDVCEYLHLVYSIAVVGTQHDSALVFKAGRCLELVLKNISTNHCTIHNVVMKCCLAHINSINHDIRKMFWKILMILPLDLLIRPLSINQFSDFRPPLSGSKQVHHLMELFTSRELWKIKRHHVSKSVTQNTFQAHKFANIMSNLLNPNSKSRVNLPNYYWGSQRSDTCVFVCRDGVLSANEGFLRWWSLWECAQYTISNKLRTPLGKAQDTFQKIEAAVREYENQLLSRSVPRNKTKVLNKGKGLIPVQALFANTNNGGYLLPERPHLLMQFLENLEKQMYNAYEGCVAMPSPNKAVRTFFTTNKPTCMQWLNRLRLALMHVALQCGCPHTVWHHGQLILADMRRNNNLQGLEFERAVEMSICGLIQLQSPQHIEGMYRWCRSLNNGYNKQQWSWIKAAKEEASNSFESAVREYKSFLNNKQAHKTDNASNKAEQSWKQFAENQVVECYMSLASWDEAEEWMSQQEMSETSVSSINLQYIRALSSFDEENFAESAKQSEKFISDIASFHPASFVKNGKLPPASKSGNLELQNWCWPLLAEICHSHFINIRSQKDDKQSFVNILDEIQEVSSAIMRANASQWPIRLSEDFTLIAAICRSLRNGKGNMKSFTDKFCSESFASLDVLNKLLIHLRCRDNTADDVFELESLVAKTCRKTGNHSAATNMLLRQLHNLVSEDVDLESISSIKEFPSFFEKLTISDDISNFQKMITVQSESAKLLQVTGNADSALKLMANVAIECLKTDDTGLSCGKSLVTLSKQLQSEWKHVAPVLKPLISENCDGVENDLTSKLSYLMKCEGLLLQPISTNEQVIAEAKQEVVIGSLLKLATMKTPQLGKAWFGLAAWSYKWGRKILDTASNSGNFNLTTEEQNCVAQVLLPHNVSKEYVDEVCAVLAHAHCATSQADEKDSELLNEQQQRLDVAEVIYEQLRLHCGHWMAQLPSTVPQSLLVVWQSVCKRLFALYEIAADAYFKFLKHNTGTEALIKYEDSNVTATLRLLRLLVKHALELQATLEHGIATTPTEPWKDIIPQLFSRLNHPEPYVRQSIAELLCRVAHDSPYLIVYPVVVETTDQRKKPVMHVTASLSVDKQEIDDKLLLEGESQEEDALEETKTETTETKRGVNQAYTRVLQALVGHNEEMVSDVRLLVLELRRITLLWDELWIGTLSQHQQDINRRLQQLTEEAKRVNSNHSLTKDEKQLILREQQQAIMRPVVYALKRIVRITSAEPDTPHEKWFHLNMQPLVDEAMEKLTNPPNPHNPISCWSGFKQLQSQLSNRAGKLRPSSMLSLADISPKLQVLKATSMPIPGVTSARNSVSILSCSHVVQILPTKTKPKKLQFVGSDGVRYTYLFKGLEDLHLDERIMQFLMIANCLLRRQHPHEHYVARHYSVTPLGPRSGLIQWVGGAKPLFMLYKRWQQRQTTVVKQAGASTTDTQVLRPSDVYYNKLNPLLKKNGVDPERTNRKEWPLKVMREVLEELIAETPDDLLQKELWCLSTGSADYWNTQQKYCHSTAVMSMIGYVIGLGDRHLDNVLIDFDSGEVVHIDYNVCFEKGMQLRVPEKVPFRLTQNFTSALGLCGVEGQFRNACEHILSVMRKSRETLLTLLEAFVYDPLVDWTGTAEGGYAGAVYGGGEQTGVNVDPALTKRDVEREITKSLFSSRVAEMKQGWFENRDEMLKTLPKLTDQLLQYKAHFTSHVDTRTNIQNLLEVKSQIKQALVDANNPLNSLKQRWFQHKQQQNKKTMALDAIETKMTECGNNVNRYKALLASLKSTELAGLLVEVSKELIIGPAPFESAVAFLNSAGQSTLVTQALSAEKELQDLMTKRRFALRTCLDTLSTYAAVVGQFPPNAVIRQHWETVWGDWLAILSASFTEADCQNILDQYSNVTSQQAIMLQSRSAQSKEHALRQEVNNLNMQLIKLLERRNSPHANVPEVQALERNVQVARDNIILYAQENGGHSGLELVTCFVAMALSALEQRGIVMEATAANSGHRLVDMTSQDGDWFLEELCSLYGNICKLLQVSVALQNNYLGSKPCVTAVYSAEATFKSLLDLYNNFRNIIVPEAVKLLHSEEASVLEMISAVIAAQQEVKLDDIAKQLINDLRSGTSSIETLETVNALKHEYNCLLQSTNQNEDNRLSAGQMLLQGFDGLFHKAHSKFYELLNMREKSFAESPHVGNTLDVINDSEKLVKIKQLTGNNDTLRALLFIKQSQAMHDFFVLCKSNVQSFTVDRSMSPGRSYHHNKGLYSEERLAKPVKHYIAHFVQELLIGIPSQVLGHTLCEHLHLIGYNFPNDDNVAKRTDDVCKHIVDSKFQAAEVNQPRMLVYQYNRSWKDMDRVQRLDANITSLRASLQRAQLQLTRFHWLHDDIVRDLSDKIIVLRRGDILTELGKCQSTLVRLQVMLHQTQEKSSMLKRSVEQRLKWAAGANPTLQVVLDEVQTNIEKRMTFTRTEDGLSTKVMNLCQSAIDFEEKRLRNKECDAAFISLVDMSQRTCKAIESANIKISTHEKMVINVMANFKASSTTNSMGIDEAYLSRVGERIQQSVTKLRQTKSNDESKMHVVKSNLQDLVAKIKQLLSGHGKLLQDVKSLLMSLAKYEEGKGETVLSGDADSVKEFLDNYKGFCSLLGDVLMDVLQGTEAQIMLDPDPLITRLQDITDQVMSLYGGLVNFASPLAMANGESSFANATRGGLNRGDVLTFASPTSDNKSSPRKKIRDARTGKAIQQRNYFAVSVWKRVKAKLEGRDAADSLKRMQIPEQVDCIINEATSVDNLALLYEGWTAWV